MLGILPNMPTNLLIISRYNLCFDFLCCFDIIIFVGQIIEIINKYSITNPELLSRAFALSLKTACSASGVVLGSTLEECKIISYWGQN